MRSIGNYADNNTTFVALADEARKANKGKWVSFAGLVGGREVLYKAFNTYIQILTVDGIDHAPGMGDESVKHFRESLTKTFPQSV